VKLAGTKGYVFPDVSVVCGPPEFVEKHGVGCLVNPVLVVEVLSPSTAYRDENEKLFAYTGMRSVREYLVVSTSRYGVKLYSRQGPDEIWSVRLYTLLTDVAILESCGCALSLAEIYAGVELSSEDPFAIGGDD
jgi:Uma2 family endonuclease